MERKENRRYLRYRISTEVEVRYGDKSIVAEAVNISNQGIGIQSSIDIRPETSATVTVQTPQTVSLYCTAIWSIRTPFERRNEHRIGFSIDGLFYNEGVHHDPDTIDKVIQEIVASHG